MTLITLSLILLAPGEAGNVGCLLIPAIRERLSPAERWAIWAPLMVYFVFSIAHVQPLVLKSLGNLVEFLWIDALAPGYLAVRWAMNRNKLGSRAQWLVIIASVALPCAVYFLAPSLPE